MTSVGAVEAENEGGEVNERKKLSRIGRGEPGKRYEDRFNITETDACEKITNLQDKRGRPKLYDNDGKNRSSITFSSPDRGSTSYKRSNCADFFWKSKSESIDYEEYNDQILDEFVTNLSKDSDEFPRKFPKSEERYHAVIPNVNELQVIPSEAPILKTNNSGQLLWKPDNNEKQAHLSKVMLNCRSSLCVPGTILQASMRNQACYVCVLGPSIAPTSNSEVTKDMLVVFDGENNRTMSAFKCSPLVAEDNIIAIFQGLHSPNSSSSFSSTSSSCSLVLSEDDNATASSQLLIAAMEATNRQWKVFEVEEYLRGRKNFQDNLAKIYNNSSIPITRSMKDLIYFHEYFLALTRTTEGQDNSQNMMRLFKRAEIILDKKAIDSVSSTFCDFDIRESNSSSVEMTYDFKNDSAIYRNQLTNDLDVDVTNVMDEIIRIVEKTSLPEMMCGYSLLCVNKEVTSKNIERKNSPATGDKNVNAEALEVNEVLILPTLETLEIWDEPPPHISESDGDLSGDESDSSSSSSGSERFDENTAVNRRDKAKTYNNIKPIPKLNQLDKASANQKKRLLKSQPVEQVDLITGMVVRRYSNKGDASISMGIPGFAIFNCCMDGKITSYNYRWRFYEGVESKDWNEGMKTLSYLKAIVHGPFIKRNHSRILDTSEDSLNENNSQDVGDTSNSVIAATSGTSNSTSISNNISNSNNASNATLHVKRGPYKKRNHSKVSINSISDTLNNLEDSLRENATTQYKRGPYMKRFHSNVLDIPEDEFSEKQNDLSYHKGTDNVSSGAMAARSGTGSDSPGATEHLKRPISPNNLEVSPPTKRTKSPRGSGVPGSERKASNASYREIVEPKTGLTYRQIVVIALSKMAPRDKGSLDRGSLSSEIEIKVLQLFPMVLENSDISRIPLSFKSIIQQALLIAEQRGYIDISSYDTEGVKRYQLSTFEQDRLSILQAVLGSPVVHNQTSQEKFVRGVSSSDVTNGVDRESRDEWITNGSCGKSNDSYSFCSNDDDDNDNNNHYGDNNNDNDRSRVLNTDSVGGNTNDNYQRKNGSSASKIFKSGTTSKDGNDIDVRDGDGCKDRDCESNLVVNDIAADFARCSKDQKHPHDNGNSINIKDSMNNLYPIEEIVVDCNVDSNAENDNDNCNNYDDNDNDGNHDNDNGSSSSSSRARKEKCVAGCDPELDWFQVEALKCKTFGQKQVEMIICIKIGQEWIKDQFDFASFLQLVACRILSASSRSFLKSMFVGDLKIVNSESVLIKGLKVYWKGNLQKRLKDKLAKELSIEMYRNNCIKNVAIDTNREYSNDDIRSQHRKDGTQERIDVHVEIPVVDNNRGIVEDNEIGMNEEEPLNGHQQSNGMVVETDNDNEINDLSNESINSGKRATYLDLSLDEDSDDDNDIDEINSELIACGAMIVGDDDNSHRSSDSNDSDDSDSVIESIDEDDCVDKSKKNLGAKDAQIAQSRVEKPKENEENTTLNEYTSTLKRTHNQFQADINIFLDHIEGRESADLPIVDRVSIDTLLTDNLSRRNVNSVIDLLESKDSLDSSSSGSSSRSSSSSSSSSSCRSRSESNDKENESSEEPKLQIRPDKGNKNEVFSAAHDFIHSVSDENHLRDTGLKEANATRNTAESGDSAEKSIDLNESYNKGNMNGYDRKKERRNAKALHEGEGMPSSTEKKRKRKESGEEAAEGLSTHEIKKSTMGFVEHKDPSLTDGTETLSASEEINIEYVRNINSAYIAKQARLSAEMNKIDIEFVENKDPSLSDGAETSSASEEMNIESVFLLDKNRARSKKQRLKASKTRAIECYHNGALVHVFDNLDSIGQSTPFLLIGILKVLDGKQVKSAGFNWKYCCSDNVSSSNDFSPVLKNGDSANCVTSTSNIGNDYDANILTAVVDLSNNIADEPKSTLSTINEGNSNRSDINSNEKHISDDQLSSSNDDIDQLPLPIPLKFVREKQPLLSIEELLQLRETLKGQETINRKTKVDLPFNSNIQSVPFNPNIQSMPLIAEDSI